MMRNVWVHQSVNQDTREPYDAECVGSSVSQSRHTVVCHAAQEASATGRTVMQFLRICNFVLLVRNQTIFAVEMASTISTPHSKFQLNRPRQYELSKIGLVSSFICFFCQGVKGTIKWKRVIQLP